MNDEEKDESPPEVAVEAPPAKPAKPVKKPMPGWMVLVGIVLFFIVVIALCYLIWLAASTLKLGERNGAYGLYGSGRVVERQVYDDIQGWSSELLIDKKPNLPARVRFLLRGKDRKPITDADVKIEMVSMDDPPQRGTHAVLAMKEPGVYRGDVNIPAGGLWEARVQVKEGGNAYQITRQVAVPEGEKDQK